MNKRLLWALLSWLSLLSIRGQAQNLAVQETFEGLSTDFGYSNNTVTAPYQTDPSVEYFERRAFTTVTGGTGYTGTTQGLNNRQGSYTWAGEGVRGTQSSNFRSAGYVVLNPITNSQNYRNFVITVAMAAPRGGTFTGAGSNSTLPSDRIRIQYSFGGGPWTTAKLLMGNNRNNPGLGDFEDIVPLSDSSRVGQGGTNTPTNAGTVLDQTYRDITATLPATATGTDLRVRVVLDFRSGEAAFDNIRVTGTLDNTAKPTLSGVETTPLLYTEGSNRVQITNSIQVTHASAATLAGGSVTITGFVAGDVLYYVNQNGITGSYNTGNGVLTLTGNATLATYQAALRSIAYQNTNTTTLPRGTRAINFQVTDNTAVASGTVTRSVTVTPSLNNAAALNYTESFDADGEGTRYFGNSFVNTATQAGFFRATNSPATSGGSTISTNTFTGWSGGYWYGEGSEDSNNPNNPTSTLQLAPVDATGRSGLRFTIAVGATSNWRGYNDAVNPGESFELFYRVNGGSPVKFAAFYGTSPSGGPARLDGDNDITTVATGTALSTTLQDFTFNLPASAAVGNLDFLLVQRARGNSELAFDNIRITGVSQPTVTTATPAGITSNRAVLGGSVTADGGDAVTDRGVVYSATNQTPTTADTKDANGTGTGSFSETITGLAPATTYYVRAYAINSAGTSYGAVVSFTTLAPVSGTTVVTNVSCFSGSNGTINLTPTGGVAPYTFLWNNGATTEDRTGLVAGAYSVTITDAAGATGVVNNIIVTQPSAIGASTVQTNIACNGSSTGAASVTPAGGTAPYTYRWSTGATTQGISGLAAGSYSVTITDANGCTRTYSFNITQPPALTATTSQTDVTTNGGSNGSATITVSGGTPSYTYSWSPNVSTTATASNLRAGTYTVTATDVYGCTITRSFTIAEPAAVTVVSVTRLTPSPTATTQARYQVVFSGSVSGLTVSNFSVTQTGLTGASISSVVGSGARYTVTANTGTGDGTLRVNVANSTGISPTVTNVPYTAGEVYTITKTFSNPILTIQGTGGTGSDVTAFVDAVQVLSGGTAVANALQNGSFEQHDPLSNGDFGYQPTSASWTFNTRAGIAESGSAFSPTTPLPNGIAVAFIQSNGAGANGQIQQGLTVPTGSYQVNFQASQRVCCTTLDQSLNVFINGVFVGTILPGENNYQAFTSATFNVTAPALTATISSTAGASGSTTATSPIPFTVTFSQNATGFTASDLVVTGGTVSGFTGSGTTYTFNVTPSASGTVTVNVPANSAFDGNNTGNTAATQYSLIFAQPVTAAPVVLVPANGSSVTTTTPTYAGTAPAGSVVRLYVDGVALPNTVTANSAGNWAISQPTSLAQGAHTVYATAQSSGSSVSANSATNTFTVDSVRPTVALSSSAGATGSTTSTSPIPYTVRFSEAVTGFVAGDVTVNNGVLTGFTGSGANYAFNVTPTTAGTATTVNIPANVAQDQAGNGNIAAAQLSITYLAPVITVTPATLPDGTVATAYSQTVTASGGTAPYTFAITAGALPAGLTLTSGGTLSGTPTAGGTFNFTVAATDAANFTGTRSYSLVIAAPVITVAPATLPAGTVASAYSQTVTASGGTAPYSFAITAGALPTGLTLTSTGVLSGTPTASGTFNFTVTATDASVGLGPYSGSLAYSLSIGSQPVTATPVITLPADNTFTNQAVTISGTAPANSTVVLYVSQNGGAFQALTTTATASGTFSSPALPFPAATYRAYATAQSQGAAVSANSNLVTFTVDQTAPTVALSSTAGANGSSTTTTPIPYTVTFSESVTGFVAGDVTVSNGTISGFTGSGASYTFNVTPTTPGTATTVNIAAGVAQDQAGNGNSAATQLSITYQLDITSWTGLVSTDWYTAGNWSAGVPNNGVDATVPASAPNMPAIAAGTAQARNLTLNAGATLTQTGGTLLLTANLTNNGTYTPNGGTVSLGSTQLASVLGSSNTRFWNLTIGTSAAQLSTSARTSVQRLFTLNGSFTTNGNPLTLESNATTTAVVVNNGSASVSGNVTVERYIDPSLNAGLGYRHYSAPISSASVASLATASFSPVVNPTYNTSATPTSERPFPTVYGYNQDRLTTTSNNLPEFDKGWFSPATTGDALAVGQGYTLNTAAGQTLAVTGTLNNGTLPLALASNRTTQPNGGWQLVGNPYAAPLDYSRVVPADRAGLDAAIYIYSSTGQYAGQYRTYVSGIGNPVVPSGQAFFARVAAGQASGTLTLRNNQRLTVPNNTQLQRTAAETRPLVQLTLKGTASPLSDEAFVYFANGATDGFDTQYDALKLPNTNGLNLSTSSTGQQFSIDGRSELGAVQRVIPLAVGVPTTGTYSFTTAQLLNLDTTPVYLRDVQLGTVTDLRTTPSYQFTVTNASALITGRFELVFSPQQALATVPAALAQQVALYPNPAKKAAFVELPASLGRQAVTAALVDALGRQVRTVTLPAQGALAHQLDLSELATGVYALRLSTSAGVVVKKLVIE